jgi:Chromo (CHRromatin Organisation MOdifier) domain
LSLQYFFFNIKTFQVEKILDHRRLHGTIYYRIRWEGYTSKDDSWQAKETLNCNDLLKKYHDELNSQILKREEEKLKAQQNAKKANGEYEVEAIIDSKKYKDKVKFRVRWKGFDASDDTWEPEESLNCPDLIRAFMKKSKASPKKAAKKKKNYKDLDSEEDDTDDSDYGAPKRSKGGEYEVEKILNARINRDGKWEFFVMWKGYGPEGENFFDFILVTVTT